MTIRAAMVMAAGLGRRMRPLTASRPKPLVRVGGRPMIDHVLIKLAAAEVERVVVNAHYLPDALEAHLAQGQWPFEVRVSDERERLMETGGGLVKALPLIGVDSFYCLNSDNLWLDGPMPALARLAAAWSAEAMDGLLLLVPQAKACNYAGAGDFHLAADGRVRRRSGSRQAPFVFTGVQLVHRRLLDGAPAGPFSTNLLWDRAMAAGRLFGLVHESLWFEVGSPAAIAPTERLLADG